MQDNTHALKEWPCKDFSFWWWRTLKPSCLRVDTLDAQSLVSRRMGQNPTDIVLPDLHCINKMPWYDLFTFSPDKLLKASRFFAEILIAQSPGAILDTDGSSNSDLHWARSISSIQPLPRTLNINKAFGISKEVIGWCELGFWIKCYSEPFWERISWQFDLATQTAINNLRNNQDLHLFVQPNEGDHKRVRRCWLLAMHRAEN